MAVKDLVTSARAAQNISGYSSADDPSGVLAVLITAYSDAIEKYCRRRFVSTFYDELYNGNGQKRLLLREYPIQSIQSVRYRYVIVLRISNADTTTNQQARAQITSTGLQLTRTASGVFITESLLTWATYPTLAGLAAAVNALGNGWTARLTGQDGGDYGLWPSSDLYVPSSYGDGSTTTSQGALNARGGNAALMMHTYELEGYQFDAGRGWLLRAVPYTDPELMHPEDLVWPIGVNNFRVQYTAGYSTIPEAVQEACALWVAIAYKQTQRDPSLLAQALTGSLSQSWGVRDSMNPPPRVRALLAPYRRRTISTNQG